MALNIRQINKVTWFIHFKFLKRPYVISGRQFKVLFPEFLRQPQM